MSHLILSNVSPARNVCAAPRVRVRHVPHVPQALRGPETRLQLDPVEVSQQKTLDVEGHETFVISNPNSKHLYGRKT